MMALPAKRFKIEYGDHSAIPLVGLSIVRRLRNSNLGLLCCVTTALQAEAPVPSQRPLDATIVALKAADVPADVLLKHR